MLSVGTLVWISLRPLIRLAICVGCGFAITKADIFPPVAARGAGQIMLNIALPSLMFSKIVPAFNSDNINALGPLVLVGIIYGVLGIIMAWAIRSVFWTPHRFRHGILVAGGWGNYGDIPTSVIMSITGAAPFDGTHDQNLAVAYIAALILVFFITLFPLGGHRWIAKDFVGPDVEDDDVRWAVKKHRQLLIGGWIKPASKWLRRHAQNGQEMIPEQDVEYSEKTVPKESLSDKRPSPGGRHVSFLGEDNAEDHENDATTVVPTEIGGHSRIGSPAPTEIATGNTPAPSERDVCSHGTRKPKVTRVQSPTRSVHSQPSASRTRRFTRKLYHTLRNFMSDLASPPSMVIILSFPIALIPQLKALFVAGVSGTNIPNAPDGQPPLSVILDTASFIGGASVPLGLVCLGSALARLQVPARGHWRALPLGALISLAVGKMLIMPVIGVALVKGLVHGGLIGQDDKVLQFVCIFFSSLPTATTQVMLTQVYSGTGEAAHLSAFLIPQYGLMFVTMTAVTAYTLQLLF